ncbi:MAG: methylated-DNA--[protein]-cysteine S-methyltransferase [Deltaproteobacteria bacterium]|nr:methylated-DNA--[protein]-cysteine S-methyltransferase [Deltaproteobacteria bacterium]
MSGVYPVYHLTWNTDLGPLTALATQRGLARLWLSQPDLEGQARRLAGRAAWELRDEPLPVLSQTRQQVDEYLIGQRKEFDLALDLRGTPFQMSVWQALQTVAWGRVVTYGQLAAMVSRPGAARAVGQANGANPIPIIVPCHRVVAVGGLGGYGSGLANKRVLLGLEGVTAADVRRAGQAGP